MVINKNTSIIMYFCEKIHWYGDVHVMSEAGYPISRYHLIVLPDNSSDRYIPSYHYSSP